MVIYFLRDLVRMNVVNSVPIELQNMYQLMEVEFDPLHLCCRMQVHLNWIKEKPDSGLPQYIAALQEMTITRLVKQVAQVYQTITFIRLLELSVFITPFHLERILVDLVRHNDLQVCISRTNLITFISRTNDYCIYSLVSFVKCILFFSMFFFFKDSYRSSDKLCSFWCRFE